MKTLTMEELGLIPWEEGKSMTLLDFGLIPWDSSWDNEQDTEQKKPTGKRDIEK